MMIKSKSTSFEHVTLRNYFPPPKTEVLLTHHAPRTSI